MKELLLSSKYSDDFSVGRFEELIPEHLHDRIIRYKFDIKNVNIDEVIQFLQEYDEVPKTRDRIKIAMEEFFLEQFLSKIRNKADFDSVDYVEREPSKIIKKNNYWYEFFNGGRSIRVYGSPKTECEELDPLTVIPRLVVLQKGETKHVTICDPRVVSNPKIGDIALKIESTKALIDGKYLLSHMGVYTRNLFQAGLRKRKYRRDPMYKCSIPEFLNDNPNNLCLVYSANMCDIISLGTITRGKMRAGSFLNLFPKFLRNIYK